MAVAQRAEWAMPKRTSLPSMFPPPCSAPVVGKVPAEAGTIFLVTSEPASPRSGTIRRKRPISMARPMVVSKKGVLALSPAKALPLLPVPEVKA